MHRQPSFIPNLFIKASLPNLLWMIFWTSHLIVFCCMCWNFHKLLEKTSETTCCWRKPEYHSPHRCFNTASCLLCSTETEEVTYKHNTSREEGRCPKVQLYHRHYVFQKCITRPLHFIVIRPKHTLILSKTIVLCTKEFCLLVLKLTVITFSSFLCLVVILLGFL